MGITISSKNHLDRPLASNELFEGQPELIWEYPELDLNFYGEPANAACTLTFQFSPDGTHWDVSVPFDEPDPTFFIPVPLRTVLPYFRVRVQNGSVAQTATRLTVSLHQEISRELTRLCSQPFRIDDPVTMSMSVQATLIGGQVIHGYPLLASNYFNTTAAGSFQLDNKLCVLTSVTLNRARGTVRLLSSAGVIATITASEIGTLTYGLVVPDLSIVVSPSGTPPGLPDATVLWKVVET